MATMLYKFDNKGETIVQVDSPTDYQTFKTIITDDVDSELSNGYFLTAKEAILATQITPEIEAVAENATADIEKPQRGRPRK